MTILLLIGHLEWFAKKSQIKSKSKSFDNEDDQFITATIININVDKLFKKIKEFKKIIMIKI